MRSAFDFAWLGLVLLAAVAAFLWLSGLPPTGATGGPLMALALLGLGCLVYAALGAAGTSSGEAASPDGPQSEPEANPAGSQMRDRQTPSGEDRQRRALGACNPSGILKGDAETAHRRRFRMLLESGSLADAERCVEEAAARLGDPELLDALERTARTVAIDNWARIAGAAKAVKREGHGAFIASLIHRNHECEDFEINLLYAESKEGPDTARLASPSLPQRPHANALSYKEKRPRVVGLEPLRRMQDRATTPYELWSPYHDLIFTGQMLAAEIVMVRFFQTFERCAAENPLPDGLPVFLTNDHAEWPMETGTIDFCDFAVRRL